MLKFKFQAIILILALMILVANASVQASVQSFKKENNGVTFLLDKGAMKIKICKDNIVEVQYTVLDAMPLKKSLVINNPWKSVPEFKVSEANGEITLSTAKVKVIVTKSNNSIRYTDLNDKAILSEDQETGKNMVPATIAGIATYNCGTRFNSPADEALFGLGCHPEDTLSINYKGRNQDLAIKYMTGAIPVLVSNKGYGLIWDNYSASNFYGAEGSNTRYKYVSESGKMVDYYFI